MDFFLGMRLHDAIVAAGTLLSTSGMSYVHNPVRAPRPGALLSHDSVPLRTEEIKGIICRGLSFKFLDFPGTTPEHSHSTAVNLTLPTLHAHAHTRAYTHVP